MNPREVANFDGITVSRGGWRGLSTAMSERTIPAEADSMAQLGKRVADAGGKV
jgi:hypothetical protein